MNKPPGRTSHDVVARVRRVLDGAKVGHAGTLDPEATGVLVICLGKATKISSFLMEADKVYEGTGRLGVSTDTQDATGTVLAERPVQVGEEALRALATRFVGRIEQVPPMYSAVKVDGQKLYRLARKGVQVERPARPVTVYELKIGRIALPDFEFSVRCSKGTYVRTLVHDLGEALDCGGHLARLSRARQGPFDLEHALPWEALEAPDAADRVRAARIDVEDALDFLPELTLPGSVTLLRANTRVLPETLPPGGPGLFRIALADRPNAAVGRRDDQGLHVLYLFPPRSRFGRGKRVP